MSKKILVPAVLLMLNPISSFAQDKFTLSNEYLTCDVQAPYPELAVVERTFSQGQVVASVVNRPVKGISIDGQYRNASKPTLRLSKHELNRQIGNNWVLAELENGTIYDLGFQDARVTNASMKWSFGSGEDVWVQSDASGSLALVKAGQAYTLENCSSGSYQDPDGFGWW